MSGKKNKFVIDDEMLVYRVGNGIKLVRPEQAANYATYHLAYNTHYNVKNALQLPVSFYFLNHEGATQKISDEGAIACGFDSAEDAIGKTLFDVTTGASASELINNCKQVMHIETVKMFDETNVRKDNTIVQFFSVKSPWLDEKNKIIGTCGCSIVLGTHPLATTLQLIQSLGLFNPVNEARNIKSFAIDTKLNDIALSKRQMECLQLTVKGYSAKKVAHALGISYRTVEEYLDNIKLKIGASSKAELIEMTIDYFCKK